MALLASMWVVLLIALQVVIGWPLHLMFGTGADSTVLGFNMFLAVMLVLLGVVAYRCAKERDRKSRALLAQALHQHDALMNGSPLYGTYGNYEPAVWTEADKIATRPPHVQTMPVAKVPEPPKGVAVPECRVVMGPFPHVETAESEKRLVRGPFGTRFYR